MLVTVQLSRLLTRLAALGFAPDDSEEERLTKAVLTLSASLVGVLSFAWVFTYFAIGQPLSAAIPLAYQIVSLVSLVVFSSTKRVRPFRASQLALILVLPFLLQLSLGGFVPSSGVILWALVGPIGALMFLGATRSLRWFVAYGALVAIAGLLQPALPAPRPVVPQAVIGTFFVMNILGVSTTVFLLLRYFVQERERERAKSERLLLNVLPQAIVARLRDTHGTIADGFDEVTVLFADIVDFTTLSAGAAPAEIVGLLNELFSRFDQLADHHGLEKIKTIGDAYMVAGGIPVARDDHAEAVAEMALDMVAEIDGRQDGRGLQIRIGIDTGPVVAGVIGLRKFIYDLWGDTVNTASRMESHGLPGGIQVTERTFQRLCDRYRFEERGTVQVKGKGEMRTWLLVGRR
ncbi:MAG: adenylate/guanylate cyclase domain-containing protein [Actinomycetota bacterium]